MDARILLLLLAGCGGSGLSVEPTRLDWGEIDFQAVRPETGYAPLEVTITNTTKGPLDVTIQDLDTTRLFLGAFLQSEDPPTLPSIGEGSYALITLGVWDYQDGERDTIVEGRFRIAAEGAGDPIEVPWSFKPVREIPVDTGP